MNNLKFPIEDVVVQLPLGHSINKKYRETPQREPDFRKLIKKLYVNGVLDLTKGVIDTGAWIGDNAVPWAKMIKGSVYAIDPSYTNCRYIQILKETNRLKNLHIFQKALSNKEEVLETPDGLEHCSFVFYKTERPDANIQNKLVSTTLDILVTQKFFDKLGFIHLDVEGMELQVIQGGWKKITADRPIIAFETHLERETSYGPIKTLLEGIQYRVGILDVQMNSSAQDCRNCFAIPEEIYDRFLEIASEFKFLF